MAELVRWLLDHRVSAAAMEATGVYWEVVFEALESAGIDQVSACAIFIELGPDIHVFPAARHCVA